MPTYEFKDNNTGKEWEDFMSISAKEQFLKDNPHISQVISAVPLGDPVRLGLKKPDEPFRDILRTIKKKHIHSKINTW
jgi:hypothetical protein